MIFVLPIFQLLIQNFINGSCGDRSRDAHRHQLNLRQVGRLGQTTGTGGCSRTPGYGVGGLKLIVIPVASHSFFDSIMLKSKDYKTIMSKNNHIQFYLLYVIKTNH
jgi:hypothetical protein